MYKSFFISNLHFLVFSTALLCDNRHIAPLL
nr:MAG TPA: Protein of unknown function (DUF1270) [Caudoviricetes sp.]